MGQKVNPNGLRLGIIRDWDAKWYADGDEFAELLHEDVAIRNHIKEKMYEAGVSCVDIERAANQVKVTIHTARPGMVIGRGGSEVNQLKAELEKITDKTIQINVVEVDNPNLDAQLVAENVAGQLENRVSFRRAMRQAMNRAMKSGAEGFRIESSGRLGGAEMARSEGYSEGRVPLHTLRADIDYGFTEAKTTYGRIGIKVWINKGEILPEVGKVDLEPEEAK